MGSAQSLPSRVLGPDPSLGEAEGPTLEQTSRSLDGEHLAFNCRLRLLSEAGAGESAQVLLVVPASSAALSAHSDFFRALLHGQFREAWSGGGPVDIRMAKKDLQAFLLVLDFIHNGALSPHVGSAPLLARIMRLADRFDVPQCLCASMEALGAMRKGPSCMLVEWEGGVGCAPSCSQAGSCESQLLHLPAKAVQALLRDGQLAVASEDTVLRFVRCWVWENCPSTEGRLEALGSMLWPAARFSFATPGVVLDLVQGVLDLLRGAAVSATGSAALDHAEHALVLFREQLGSDPQTFFAAHLPQLGSMSSMLASIGASLLVLNGFLQGNQALNFVTRYPASRRTGYMERGATLSLALHMDWAKSPFSYPKTCKLRSGKREFEFKATAKEGRPHASLSLLDFGAVDQSPRVYWASFAFFNGNEEDAFYITSAESFMVSSCVDWGYFDVFSETWAQVLENVEGFFPGGKLNFSVNIWLHE